MTPAFLPGGNPTGLARQRDKTTVSTLVDRIPGLFVSIPMFSFWDGTDQLRSLVPGQPLKSQLPLLFLLAAKHQGNARGEQDDGLSATKCEYIEITRSWYLVGATVTPAVATRLNWYSIEREFIETRVDIIPV